MKEVVVLLLSLMIFGGSAVFADDPIDTTICDIQQYNGIMQGDRVRITGVCTAETGRYGAPVTVIAHSAEPYCCGIWVYVPDADLLAMRGECVEVVGVVQEYYDLTELFVGSDETIRPQIVSSCPALPDPIVVQTANGSQEMYESCLIETRCVTVTSDIDDFGVFLFRDDQQPAGDMHGLFAKSWDPPVLGGFYCRMAGIIDYSWNEFRLRPRDRTSDLDETTTQPNCEYCGAPGPTYTPTPNGSPTATPTQGGNAIIDLMLNKEEPNCFIEGDWFSLTIAAQNPNATTMNLDAYVCLDVYGSYFFWDSWGQDIDYVAITLPASGSWNETLLQFDWPAGAGAASGLAFYSVLTGQGNFDIASNIEVIMFCFQ